MGYLLGMNSQRTKIAILASGEGTNFEAIVSAQRSEFLPVDICKLIYNNRNAGVKKRADRLNVSSVFIDEDAFEARVDFEQHIIEVLENENVELVILAGWMHILGIQFLEIFPHTLNIHPSLLPDFRGKDALARAFKSQPRLAGCTVHVVTEKVDEGPIVARAAIPVAANSSLAVFEATVHALEHELYPNAIVKYIRSMQ